MSKLAWIPAARKPDADITVICWLSTGEWFSGWFDGEFWKDAATGDDLDDVTHWAEPEGPNGTSTARERIASAAMAGILSARDDWAPGIDG